MFRRNLLLAVMLICTLSVTNVMAFHANHRGKCGIRANIKERRAMRRSEVEVQYEQHSKAFIPKLRGVCGIFGCR